MVSSYLILNFICDSISQSKNKFIMHLHLFRNLLAVSNNVLIFQIGFRNKLVPISKSKKCMIVLVGNKARKAHMMANSKVNQPQNPIKYWKKRVNRIQINKTNKIQFICKVKNNRNENMIIAFLLLIYISEFANKRNHFILISFNTIKMKESEMQQQQREQQFDIYFKGSKSQLFAMLYPLTGPNSEIFDHLQIDKLKYYGSEKQLQFSYKTKDFTNIDKQQFNIFYTSTALQTHSNYFYSSFHPQKKAVVWQNVTRMVQLRPTNPLTNIPKTSKNQTGEQESMEAEHMQNEDQNEMRQLTIVNVNDENNPKIREIETVPDTERSKLGKNWDISRDQYIVRLCE